MFGKKDRQLSGHIESSDQTGLKYSHPKILLIDIKNDAECLLRKNGYNVTAGSFGVPYQVPKDDKLFPVITNGSLPKNYSEQEVIVIDLIHNELLSQPKGEKYTSPGKSDWWASCSEGVIDPRPRLMNEVKNNFDRIFRHGGIFIIFADYKEKPPVILGYQEYSRISKERDIYCHSWGFLSILDDIYTTDDCGDEIIVVEKNLPFVQILSEYASGGSFLCTLQPSKWSESINKSWLTVATNKYEEPVAGLIVATEGKGLILIFPQLRDKARFLERLFKDVLPELSPHLFPHMEGARWVRRPEYELPRVLELRTEIEQIQETAKRQVIELEKSIEEDHTVMGYMHDLISETGTPLVRAVKKTLEALGFQSVLDVDEAMEKAGDTGAKREDLQIHDGSPALLVEVKGISGLPRDSAALQVWKYVAPRMKEWRRTDVQGLAIINHQRHLPALERVNRLPFREDILTNAQEQEFGLLTTWDLFKLAHSYLKNGWQPKHVRELFYQSGRVQPIPGHYELIGVVEHFWEKVGAVGVRIEVSMLSRGDRIAFELPVEFAEQDVDSLQVEKTSVSQADTGSLAGVQTFLTKGQLKKGTRVFRITEA